jgi:hypothetical protein
LRYHLDVARGWESKAVEAQQEEAAASGVRKGPPATPEQRARAAQRRTLELALAQTQAELSAACRPAHKEMLHQRLDAIRQRLAALS